MKFHTFEMFTDKPFPYVTDSSTGDKIRVEKHRNFHERLRKTLYYGKYADGSLPSATVTDVAVQLINSKTGGRKSLDQCHATKMARRARISPCALMMGILYTERLAQSNPGYLKKVSSSDLFMVSMLVASKYLYDDGEEEDAYNYDWSRAGNYHIGDLNRLEREFLESIEWKIFVSHKEFYELVNRIETRVALDKGTERGWYTYMDIGTFLENITFCNLLEKYVKNTGEVILSCSLVYSVSVALLLSSSAILAGCCEQDVLIKNEPGLIPSMSFTGYLGHSEHTLASSLSVRKRQIPYHNRLEVAGTIIDDFSPSKANPSKEVTRKVCLSCGSSFIDISHGPKSSSMVKTISKRKLTNMSVKESMFNKTKTTRSTGNKFSVISFNQVLSFMKFPFKNCWFHAAVKFPIWENSYSGILIGFSTSSATAAAA